MLYINKPYVVKNVTICFSNCENRSPFTLMGESTVNPGYLVVCYSQLPSNISYYRLKLLFIDGTEGNSQSFTLRFKYVLGEEGESLYHP